MTCNNASKCCMCQYFYPITDTVGQCSAPLPVWAWELIVKLPSHVKATCPATQCPLFSKRDNWELSNKQRMGMRKMVRQDPKKDYTVFDHAQLDSEFDPCSDEYKARPQAKRGPKPKAKTKKGTVKP